MAIQRIRRLEEEAKYKTLREANWCNLCHLTSSLHNHWSSFGFLLSAGCWKLKDNIEELGMARTNQNRVTSFSFSKIELGNQSRSSLIELGYVQKTISICIWCIEMFFFPPTHIIAKRIFIWKSHKTRSRWLMVQQSATFSCTKNFKNNRMLTQVLHERIQEKRGKLS
jgi:hypothetical protein